MRQSRRIGVAVLLAVAGISGSFDSAVQAAPPHPSEASPSTLVYVVLKGDSLSLIANRLQVTLSDLLTVNQLQRTSVIYPGTRLIVPVGGSLPTTSTAPPALVYTVATGDGLIMIANKLHVTISALLSANGLQLSSVIHPGLQLKVPPGGTLPTPSTSTSTTTTLPPTTTAAPLARYAVVRGDSLSGIALKLNVTLSLLLTTNGLQRTSLILPGQQLAVPPGGSLPTTTTTTTTSPPTTTTAPPSNGGSAGSGMVYVVRSGDFLIGIASLLGVPLNDLLSVNSLTRQSLIYPGKRLVVPVGGHLPGDGPGSPTATGSEKIDAVLAFARAQLGEPYKFNAAGPDTWDCSGLTLAAYAQAGVSLPHYSGAQAVLGVKVDWQTDGIRPGDLVFLATNGNGVVNHVGIAISATQYIHAPRTGDVVKIANINFAKIVTVRRYVD